MTGDKYIAIIMSTDKGHYEKAHGETPREASETFENIYGISPNAIFTSKEIARAVIRNIHKYDID